MKDRRDTDVTDFGAYMPINAGNVREIGFASASLPLVFGKNNNVNPTEFMDGGLFDNLPTGPLSDHFDGGEIDCLLVIDVARHPGAVRRELIGTRIGRSTPLLYVGLSGSQRKRLLDFGMAGL